MKFFLALVLAIAFTQHALGAPEIRWALGTSTQPERLLTALESKFDPTEYADVDVVRVSSVLDVSLARDRIVERKRRVLYFRTVEGAQERATQRVLWDAGEQSLVMREAAVLTPTGDVLRIDPADARTVDTDSYDIFTDERELVLVMPGVSAGASVVIEYELTTRRAEMVTPWQRLRHLRGYDPIFSQQITVRWDQGVDPPVRAQRGTLGSAERGLAVCEQSPRELVCDVPRQPPLTRDEDVNYYDVSPLFVVGEKLSWDDVIARTMKGVSGAANNSEVLEALFVSLSQGTSTPQERVENILAFAAREVRYHSASQGQHSIVPHPVQHTIDKRYGDCKDKSTLLWALLRRAGVDAFPTLVATYRNATSALMIPGFGYFDHMVVCWNEGGETVRCLDPTDAHSGSGFTPAWIQGRVGLPLIRGARPTNLPADQHRWRLSVDAKLDFGPDGSQSENTVVTYAGPYAGHMRARLSGKSDEEIRKTGVKMYHNVVSEKTQPVVDFSGLEDPSDEVRLSIEAGFPQLIEPSEPLSYVEEASWLRDVVSFLKHENSTYDYRFAGLKVALTYTFSFDPRWQVQWVGADLEMKHRFGELIRTHHRSGNEVTFRMTLTMPRRRIPAADRARFNGFLNAVSLHSSMRLTGTGS